MEETFDPDLIHAIFKLVWSRRSKKVEGSDAVNLEQAGTSTSKKSRAMTANANALKVSCELLKIFVAEAIQRAATIAEAEGIDIIEPTHLERVLPQFLSDF